MKQRVQMTRGRGRNDAVTGAMSALVMGHDEINPDRSECRRDADRAAALEAHRERIAGALSHEVVPVRCRPLSTRARASKKRTR